MPQAKIALLFPREAVPQSLFPGGIKKGRNFLVWEEINIQEEKRKGEKKRKREGKYDAKKGECGK